MAMGGEIIPLAGTADDNPWMGVRFSGPLVGRDAELGRLDAALARASRGSSAVVLVGGEAGVGKSRLAAEATHRAGASGARVLSGACVQVGEEALPYAPFADALRPLVRALEPAALDELVGPWRPELARLLPDLGRPGPWSRWARTGASPRRASSSWCSGCWSAWPRRRHWSWCWRTCTGRTGPAWNCSPSSPTDCASRRPCWWPPTGAMSCTAATGSVRCSPTSTATPPSSGSSCGASAVSSSPSRSPPASSSSATCSRSACARRPTGRSRRAPAACPPTRRCRWGRIDLVDLVAAPASPHPEPSPAERLGLTRREQEVLALVAAGRTNRQIAEELFISVKTAGIHVSNILAKLGVASRVEAATTAHRAGRVDDPAS
jgi:DNA-binding CsgD family transcriptional regulator